HGPASTTVRPLIVSPAIAAGSQAQFTGVAPCRIIDTRVTGGVLVASSRVFTAVGPYSPQGGNAAGCGIPSGIQSVLMNVGAQSYLGSNGYVKGWATGASEPLASLVNFNKSGPIANMVVVPVDATGHFTLKTAGSAQLYVDVAGYYLKPLYVAVTPAGNVYGGISSGVVSTARSGTGSYTVTFDRNVRNCAAVGDDIIFAGSRDVSADVGFDADPSTVTVAVTNSSDAPEDTYFTLSLTC
ncbi:MAG TPA: hypothetical protein VIJ54_02260, partial [Actinomycetes bacterium]